MRYGLALSACALGLTFTSIGVADEGPAVELAPEHKASKPPVALGTGKAPADAYLHGMTEQRFRNADESSSSTALGGYGEVVLSGVAEGGGRREWTANLERIVLFVAHTFDARFRFYAELEFENANACADCPGEVGVEQVYLDAKIHKDALALRGGAVIVPMGIVNQWHEPPVFHGVFRPEVETRIIPSTWHELGAGAVGEPLGGLRYEAYVVTALAPNGLTAEGMEEVKQEGALARANAVAGTLRVEYEPVLGAIVGAAGYATDAGGNATLFSAPGVRARPSFPVLGFEVDARIRKAGLEAKALYTEFHLTNAAALDRGLDRKGEALYEPTSAVASVMRGAYAEVAYDVLRPLEVSHQLLPFVRLEHTDTQAAMPAGFRQDARARDTQVVMGVSYRPIQQIVVKGDFELRHYRAGDDQTQIDLGFGFMY